MTATLVTTNIDSEPRGGFLDIGADEYIHAHVYLPLVLRDY